jgi:hypothetical protein
LRVSLHSENRGNARAVYWSSARCCSREEFRTGVAEKSVSGTSIVTQTLSLTVPRCA